MTKLIQFTPAAGAVLAVSLAAAPVAAQQWRDEANARIAQHRMGDLNISVVDEDGNAVRGADVHVAMQKHSFIWGTSAAGRWMTADNYNGRIYREKIAENFNHAVLSNDLKWPAWNGEWSHYPKQRTFDAIDWFDAHDMPVRGHNLAWATFRPEPQQTNEEAHGGDPDITTLKQRLFDHITDKVTTVGNRVTEWDAINHPVGWRNDNYVTAMEDAGLYDDGRDFYVDLIQHARSVAPDGMEMWVNEDGILADIKDTAKQSVADQYYDQIQYLIDNGAAPDGIGMQGHYIQPWGRTPSPEQMYDQIDRFAQLIPKIQITELDIDVGTDFDLQAEVMRDALTVFFSHEAMDGVSLWGMWKDNAWRKNAALYLSDWTEKPALHAYQDLVFDQWWTDEMLDTDAEGDAALRAFAGEYLVTVTVDGEEYEQELVLTNNGGSLQFMIGAPVPEPTTAALLFAGPLMLLRRRR